MPLPFVAGLAVGAKAFGLGSAAYGGYQATSYVYNGVRDWIDPSRVEKRQTELLVNLTKEKQEKESERMQHLDEVVKGIQQRKEELDTSVVQQQREIQTLVQGVGTDSAAIQKQAEELTPLSEGLEKAAREQEELIHRLQKELHEKQVAFEEAKRQLAESDARLKEASKELVETKEQTEASNAELALVKRELVEISNKNKEKDSRLDMLEKRISAQEISFEKTIKAVKTENTALLNDLKEAQQLIDELSQQLEQAQENNRSRSPSPSFFK